MPPKPPSPRPWAIAAVLVTAAIGVSGVALAADADNSSDVPSEVLRQARGRLIEYPSLSCVLRVTAVTPSGSVESVGRYTAADALRIRMELDTQLGQLTGRLLEVCDGQVLWSVRRLEGLQDTSISGEEEPSVETTIVRRDIERVRQALATEERTPRQMLHAELAVGGLPSLLAGLEQAFHLRSIESPDGVLSFRGPLRALTDDAVTAKSLGQLPISAQLDLDAVTLLPLRVSYFRADGGHWRLQQRLELSQYVTDSQPPAEFFRFTPPSEVDVVDRTESVINAIREASPRTLSQPE